MSPRAKLWRKSLGDRGLRVYLFERTPGGSIYREVWIDGKRAAAKKSLGHSDKERAEAQTYALLAKLKARRDAVREQKLTLSTLFDMYTGSPAFESKKSRTQHEDRRKLKRAIAFLGEDRDVLSLTADDVERYRRVRMSGEYGPTGKPVRARAVEADLSVLRAALNWAVGQRRGGGPLLDRNPLQGVSLPREKNPRRPVATDERYFDTLGTASHVLMKVSWFDKPRTLRSHLSELLQLANETGRRISAIRQLRRSDVLLDRGAYGSLRFRADSDKMGYESIVPISLEARGVLEVALARCPSPFEEAWLFPAPGNVGEPVSRYLCDKWLREAEKEAKLDPLVGGLWHPYRRKFASDMVDVPDRIVAKLGGWKTPRTLDLYSQPSEEVLASALSLRRGLGSEFPHYSPHLPNPRKR
jgi:integrase